LYTERTSFFIGLKSSSDYEMTIEVSLPNIAKKVFKYIVYLTADEWGVKE